MESQTPNINEIAGDYYCHNLNPEGAQDGKDKVEFEMTRDELEQITKAFKDEKFRQMLTDYVEEVRNPDNQLIYQREMTQLEKERGNIVHFINPQPGYVLKTSVNGESKAFINICSNTLIKQPNFEASVQNNKKGNTWSLPYTQSPGREDLDKAGKKCKVYDVIFNPIALILATKNNVLRTKLEQTVIDAVEKSFDVQVDKVNIKKPKLSYKGPKTPIVVRYKIGTSPPDVIDSSILGKESPPISDKVSLSVTQNTKSKPETTVVDTETKKIENKSTTETLPVKKDYSKWTKPKYSLKYRSHVDMQDYCLDAKKTVSSTTPDELQLVIELPMLSSSKGLDADVIDDGHGFELISDTKALYYLKIRLPYQVDADSAKAKFDKEKRKLIVMVKVIKKASLEVGSYAKTEASDDGRFVDEKTPALVSIVTSESNEISN